MGRIQVEGNLDFVRENEPSSLTEVGVSGWMMPKSWGNWGMDETCRAWSETIGHNTGSVSVRAMSFHSNNPKLLGG